jgi:hypothetical protein
VWVSVEEEVVTVRGILRYDQLQLHSQAEHLDTDADWSYTIPTAWFDPDIGNLLLYCRALDPRALGLPVAEPSQAEDLSAVSTVLQTLPIDGGPLSQHLSWPQAAVLMNNPQLLRERFATSLAQGWCEFSEQVINVGHWFQDQLDAVAEEWSYALLPAPVFAEAAMRGNLELGETDNHSEQRLQEILNQLKHQGVNVPPQVRGIRKPFNIADSSLELYAITWLAEAEWSLLLILGLEAGEHLPVGLRFMVNGYAPIDQPPPELLSDQVVTTDTEVRYLYAQVTGSWDERFFVTLRLVDGTTLRLPAFGFVSE